MKKKSPLIHIILLLCTTECDVHKIKKICFCLKLHEGCFFKLLNVSGKYFYCSMTFHAYNVLCDHFLMLSIVVVQFFTFIYDFVADIFVYILLCPFHIIFLG